MAQELKTTYGKNNLPSLKLLHVLLSQRYELTYSIKLDHPPHTQFAKTPDNSLWSSKISYLDQLQWNQICHPGIEFNTLWLLYSSSLNISNPVLNHNLSLLKIQDYVSDDVVRYCKAIQCITSSVVFHCVVFV